MTVLLVNFKEVSGEDNRCDVAEVNEYFDIKNTEENPVISENRLIDDGEAVEVICKTSKVLSLATCHAKSWKYNDKNCLAEIPLKKEHKRKKRFFGFVRGIVCLFARCSRPRPRDRTPPELRNCPTDIYREAIPYQFFAFVTWNEPTAWDSNDGGLSVTRSGKRPGAPFFEGQTRVGYSAKDRSGNSRSCHFHIHITVVRCPALSPRIDDGYRICHLSFDMVKGTTCQYGCYQGHDLKGGPSFSECLPTGIWSISSEPHCKKRQCEEITTMQPKTVTCSNQLYFRSICTFSCYAGYDIPDGVRRTKVCLASGQWNGMDPFCADIEPPIFEQCPSTKIFYPGDNEDKATIYWDIQTVYDNNDDAIVPEQTSGPAPGSQQDVGTYIVSYEATDTAGNVATCSFQVIVKQLRCQRLYSTPYLNLNCTGTRRGSSCSFSCDENSSLNGTHFSYCQRVAEQPYSKWTMKRQPFCQVTQTCPEIDAPLNGAMACDVWLGGRFCHPSCAESYSVLFTNPLPDFVICTEDGKWWYENEVTDCIAKSQSRRRLAEMSAEFYFTGDCNDMNVQVEIKSDFIKIIQSSESWKSKCQSDCSIGNVKVMCGDTSRRKRSATNLILTMNMYFESNDGAILSSDAYEEEVQTLADVLDILKENFSSISMLSSTVNITLQLVSLTSGSLDTECPENYIPDYGHVIGCVPCPPGQPYDSNRKACVHCERGSYQPLSAQNKCMICPPTQSTGRTGAITSSECEDACGPGTYSPSGLPPCIDCDVGFYEKNYGSVGCSKCPGNKITLREKSTSVSECHDFDLVFPSMVIDSYSSFNDPLKPLQVPFTMSMHIKVDSPDGQIASLTSSGMNISITTTTVTVNGDNERIPEDISLLKKWYYITLHLTELNATLYIDENLVLVFQSSVLESFIAYYDITLGGDGFDGSISQFIIVSETVYGTKSRPFIKCGSENNNNNITIKWNDFAYSTLFNSYIHIPSKCDDTDDCSSSPCLYGQCSDKRNGYLCSCLPGFTDVNCDVNIDDCKANVCQNNATCIDGIGNYSCACEYGYTGDLCEITMVDGSWADWDNWTDCSVSCGNGTRQRRRSCSNPLPDNGGKYCDGNDTDVEECILDPCRVCFDLIATNHSSLTCNNISEMIVCTQTCDDGFWFDRDVKDDYRCGNETSYYWDFQTDDNPYARLPQCTNIIEPIKIHVAYTAFYDKKDCGNDVMALVEETVSKKLTNLACRHEGTCEKESYDILHCNEVKRKKRDVLDENVGFRFNLSCNIVQFGAEECYVKLADAVKEIHTLENGEELDFLYASKTFKIISNTSMSDSTLDCPEGSIPYILYCVPCSSGHFYNADECHDCPIGTYQYASGKTYCHSCPEGTTTEGTASLSVHDCVVPVDNKNDEKLWYVIGIVLGIPAFIICVVVTVLLCRQNAKQKQNHFFKTMPVRIDRVNKTSINLKRLQTSPTDLQHHNDTRAQDIVTVFDNLSFAEDDEDCEKKQVQD